ncbi:hypothetical protein [Helicobacter sp. 11S03491-1]|uniref:hypothetical protein n=1 Tax=Helicobacter sp. 11S03491-1 TaxID=1476196 RepID=UPI000BA5ADF1|nr:hypothetical protein [Helicobacter sp. 11S03491-1]PAF42603.1 hypothetical protein BKH45_03565 [Helicobacter sp. 11S03491-1]
MEEAIEILKKIGIKEIQKTTKISASKLEDILQKRFSNLQRVRVVGFLKILEREYKVDLSEWLKEYDENVFTQLEERQNIGIPHPVEHPLNNLDLDTQKPIDDLIAERKKQLISKKRFYISLIIVVIILGGYFVYKNIFSNSPGNTSIHQKTTNITPSSPPNLQNNQQEEALTQAQSEQTQQASDHESEKSAQKVPSSEISIPPEASDLKSQESSMGDEIIIGSDKSLWIEVIDLQNNQKYQKIIEGTYGIKITSDKLVISFGHGEFSMQLDDKTTAYHNSYPMRFLYTSKDGIKQIKYSQYLKLTGQEIND